MLPPGCVTLSKYTLYTFQQMSIWKQQMVILKKKKDGTRISEAKSGSFYLLCCWWCGPKVEGHRKGAVVTQQKSPRPNRTRHQGSARTSHRTRHQSHTQWLNDIIKGEARWAFRLDPNKHPSYGIRLRPLRGDNVGWSRTLCSPRCTRHRRRRTRSQGTGKEAARWYLSESF